MLKIAVYHYRVPLSLVTEETGRKRFCGPPRLFISDRIRRKKKMPISNRGGKTIVEITDPYGNVDGGPLIVATGVSVCSMSDNFDYRVGARKALWAAKQVIFSAIDDSTHTHKEWDEAVDTFFGHGKKVVDEKMEFSHASVETLTPVAFVHASEANWAGVQAKLDELSAYIDEVTEVVGVAKKMAEDAIQKEAPKKSGRKSKKKEV